MRILDADTSRPVNNLSLHLTPGEAQRVLKYLEDLLAGKVHDVHLSDETCEREITLSLYTEDKEIGESSRKIFVEEF